MGFDDATAPIQFITESLASAGEYRLHIGRAAGLRGRRAAVTFAVQATTVAQALALVMGTDPAMLSEQFPGAYRMSGYSVAFNLGLGVAGRTAPAIALKSGCAVLIEGNDHIASRKETAPRFWRAAKLHLLCGLPDWPCPAAH